MFHHIPFIRLSKQHINLLNHNQYYSNLSGKHKKVFERRVARFIHQKKFIGRGEIEHVTPKMRLLIAACAVQITFGFPKVTLKHFRTFLIYPDNYYSTITKKYHKGEVNARGLVVLSWQNFLEGNHIPNDGVHLGLHEIAHALQIENRIKNGQYNFMCTESWHQFNALSKIEIKRINSNKSDFFRAYAATNSHEFFAVFVENFFERPFELKIYNEDLYNSGVKLLNQDPIRLLY